MHRTALLMVFVAVSTIGFVEADETTRTTAPQYRRVDPKPREIRRKPERAPLPSELQHDGLAFDKARPEPRDPRPAVRDAAIEARARSEARLTAERLIAGRGRAEYYRIGFHAGLRDGIDDPTIGRQDFAAGLRHGRHDPQARAEGRASGRSLADQQGLRDARAAVRAQFMDLGREPRPLAAPPAPPLDVAPPALPESTLRGVMRDQPIATFRAPFGARYTLLDGWDWDAHRLYTTPNFGAFHDAAWRDPAWAFDWWKSRRPSAWNALDAPQRQRFVAAFRRAFRAELARAHGHALERAYEDGLDDGWSYGVFVSEELHYRRGYDRGFCEAYVTAGTKAFDRTYADVWARAYRAEFDEWSHTARPVIVRLQPLDGNADGVFEPGETFDVEYEVINYGGASADVPVRLFGSLLGYAPGTSLYLPARTVTTAVLRGADVQPGVLPRSEARIELVVADETASAAFSVRRPLQFASNGLRLERDNLGGRLYVTIDVENISRKTVSGGIVVQGRAGADAFDARELPALRAGETRQVAIAIDGLDPLDLLAGQVALELDLAADGVGQDALRHAVAEVATDRRNRDLLSYLTAMASGSPFAVANLDRVRDLVLARLRADWRAAVRASGNPYKRDLKRDGTETALGELVSIWDGDRRAMVRPDVFDGMGADIVALSRDLPGAHPFLRKSMRRLAARLP